jgi:hypothetical protein
MAPRAHAAAPGPPLSGSPLPYFQGLKGSVGLGFRARDLGLILRGSVVTTGM